MRLYESSNVSVTDRSVLALRALPPGGASAREVADLAGLRVEQVQDALRRAEARGVVYRCGGRRSAEAERGQSVCWHPGRVGDS